MNLFVSALFLGLFSFGLYFITLAPTVVWGDPAKLTNFAHLNYLNIHSASHPLHCLLGYWWGKLPFPDYAYGQNLLSAIFSSMTVILLFFAIYRLTKSVFASIIAALSLSVAHTFWWLAVVNESYSLAFFCLALALLAAIAWFQTKKQGWLCLLTFALGMGISDHYAILIFAPAFILAVLIDDPSIIFDFKKIGGTILSFILGAGVLWYIYFTQFPLLGYKYLVEAGVTSTSAKFIREIIRFPLYYFYQFPLIGFVLGMIGFWASRRNKAGLFFLFLSIFLLDYFFSAIYMWQRQPEMMVFGYIIFAVWIGLGINYLKERISSFVPKYGLLLFLGIIIIPILLYSSAPYFARKIGGNVLHIRTIPYRDNDEYFLNPNKRGYYGARQFGEEVFKIAAPNSIIVADFTPYTVLQYLQLVENKRRDVELSYAWPGHRNPVVNGLIEKNLGHRAVYLADIDDYPDLYKTAIISRRYSFVKKGLVYQVMKKR